MNKKIVELRNKLGLSRASFAKALDISPSQMARIEAGKVVLSDEFLQKICSTVHVNPAYFEGTVEVEAVKVVSLEEEMKQVGKRLKQERLEKGLTLKELSDLVGLSDSQLCLIENGTNKLAEKRAVILGEALEVGVEWLLHGKERNKAFPADRKMMEWLKDHEEVREQIWKMMEN
ncbi:MAG: helix-turn-helix transcriptional regulator [Oscillospiraceae bacterium]|nr:helix-turn-helix transcriptional regulator [Oscillospiraceae bacterium]